MIAATHRGAAFASFLSLAACDSFAHTSSAWSDTNHEPPSPTVLVGDPLPEDPFPIPSPEAPNAAPDPYCHQARDGWLCFIYDDIGGGVEATPTGEAVVLGNAATSFFDSSGAWVDRLELPQTSGHSRLALDFTLRGDEIAWTGEECGADAAYPPAEPQNQPYSTYCASAVLGVMDTAGAGLGGWGFGTTGGIDRVSSLSPAPDGDLYLAGQFAAPLTLPGVEPLSSTGGIDLFLMRADAKGSVRWVETWGSPDDDGDGPQVATTSDGGVVVASHPENAVVISGFSPDGDPRFHYELGGRASAFGIAVDADDNVYVAGIERPRGYLVSVNASGVERWRRDYGEGGTMIERVIAVDVDDQGVVWAHGAAEPGTVPAPPSNAWVRQLTRDGEELWIHRWEGLWPGLRHSVTGLGDGKVAVVGRMSWPQDLGLFDEALSPAGGGASFLMVLDGM